MLINFWKEILYLFFALSDLINVGVGEMGVASQGL